MNVTEQISSMRLADPEGLLKRLEQGGINLNQELEDSGGGTHRDPDFFSYTLFNIKDGKRWRSLLCIHTANGWEIYQRVR